jgi:branched-chain amino acid aminotransferase
MMVFLSGRLVPEDEAWVSVFDRGFMLGDGVFETVPIYGGRPFCWNQHLARLAAGARCLRIELPHSEEILTQNVWKLIACNQVTDAVLRITLTRGAGSRGYSPKRTGPATLVMAIYPATRLDRENPSRWRLATATVRIPPGDALALCKHTSRIQHVMARAEAEARGFDDALLLNTEGRVVEAASGNLFWIDSRTLCTPPLSSGALAGVTRSVVLGLAHKLDLSTRFTPAGTDELRNAEEAFVTLSTLGIVEVTALDDQPIARSKLTARVRDAYWDAVEAFRSGSDSGPGVLGDFPPRD